MDREREKAFVRTFVVRRLRERLLFELGRPDKRRQGIIRLNWIEKTILPGTILAADSRLCFDEIVEQVRDRKQPCYILSDDSPPDGETMGFVEALDCVWYGLGTYILYCGRYAVIKREQEFGAPEKAILFHP